MSCTTRPQRHRAAALACSTLALGVAGLVGASAAQAGSDSWNCGLSAGQACRGDRHSLTAVSSYSGNSGVSSGAGASTTGSPSNMYGVWYTGAPSACRVFGGQNLLYPLIKNVDGGYRTIFGGSTYGSGASGC